MDKFIIFKVTEKKTEKSPDYTLSYRENDKWHRLGAGWIKTGKGGKFISVQLSDYRLTKVDKVAGAVEESDLFDNY